MYFYILAIKKLCDSIIFFKLFVYIKNVTNMPFKNSSKSPAHSFFL